MSLLEAQLEDLKGCRNAGTNYANLPAEVAENVAINFGHPEPDWRDDLQRLLKIRWMPLPACGKVYPGLAPWGTPGAFLR